MEKAGERRDGRRHAKKLLNVLSLQVGSFSVRPEGRFFHLPDIPPRPENPGAWGEGYNSCIHIMALADVPEVWRLDEYPGALFRFPDGRVAGDEDIRSDILR